MAEIDVYAGQTSSRTGINSKTLKSLELNKKTTDHFLTKLYINVSISTLFMIGEIIGGFVSGSIALLTDAFHILSDIFAFGISIAGLHLSRRPASKLMTFGFYRAEVIGALLSITIIWGLTAWLVAEAIDRITNPEEINGFVMLITAIGGLVANLIMASLLGHGHNHDHGDSHDDSHGHTHSHSPQNAHEVVENNSHDHPQSNSHSQDSNPNQEDQGHQKNHHHDKNLNMRAAFIHVLGDSLQSVGVIIAGIIIYVKPEYKIADPICTLLFCVIVLFTTIPILRDCLRILMEATPRGLEIDSVCESLKDVEDVIDVHDLHIWSLSAGKFSLSCHLVSNEHKDVLDKASKLLKDKYGIGHITIQVERGDSTEDFECENELHS